MSEYHFAGIDHKGNAWVMGCPEQIKTIEQAREYAKMRMDSDFYDHIEIYTYIKKVYEVVR